MTVDITINGSPHSFPDGATVADVVAVASSTTKGLAVAVNAELVPRSTWPSTPVAAGDRFELLTAAQGG